MVFLDLPGMLGWIVKGIKGVVHPDTRHKFRVVHAGQAGSYAADSGGGGGGACSTLGKPAQQQPGEHAPQAHGQPQQELGQRQGHPADPAVGPEAEAAPVQPQQEPPQEQAQEQAPARPTRGRRRHERSQLHGRQAPAEAPLVAEPASEQA